MNESHFHEVLRKNSTIVEKDNTLVTQAITPCTPDQQVLFDNIQSAVDCACVNGDSSLCRAIAAGDLLTKEPFNCMVQVIENHSTCGENLSPEVIKAAYNAYTDVTGYTPMNWNEIFTNLYNQNTAILNFNAFYIFMPILILILIIVWLMAGFKWITWPVALYYTTLSIVVLYGFSIAYRIHAQTFLRGRNADYQQKASKAQQSYQNSIAYMPQGIFAVACAIANDGSSDAWTCNENPYTPCPPCNTVSTSNFTEKGIRSSRTRSRRGCGSRR